MKESRIRFPPFNKSSVGAVRVETLTLHRPLVSLSLYSHPHTNTPNTHNNKEEGFVFTIHTARLVFYFLILWFQTSVAFICFTGSHLQKRRLLGKQTNHNKESLFLNVAVTMTMCVWLWATGKSAVWSPKPHGFILTRTSWRGPDACDCSFPSLLWMQAYVYTLIWAKVAALPLKHGRYRREGYERNQSELLLIESTDKTHADIAKWSLYLGTIKPKVRGLQTNGFQTLGVSEE